MGLKSSLLFCGKTFSDSVCNSELTIENLQKYSLLFKYEMTKTEVLTANFLI